MKFLAPILGIYFIMLMFVPCTDIAPRHDQDAEAALGTNSATHQHKHQHQHGENKDTCSPFCICACCGVSLENLDMQFKMPSINILLTKKTPVFEQNMYSNEFLFIWKPPKVG